MLSKIKKKKQAERKEAAKEEKAKALVKAKREFGDYIFDYFKACRHDNTTEKCVLCRLVTQTVRGHFENERQQKELAKLESKKRRAYMRYNILDNWAKNQSNYIEEMLVGFTMDVAISGSFVKALSALRQFGVEGNLQFDSMIKIMERKRRVLDIGFYAATFIQARVRKFITRTKLRREWLRRFEYAPATSHRGEFFMDTKDHKKQWSYPPLLRRLHERPNTPNTIGRRINYEEKQALARYEKYQEAMKAHYAPFLKEDEDKDILKINIWKIEDDIIYSYRQLAIVRDLIEVMTKVFIQQLITKGNKVINTLISQGKRIDKIDYNSPTYNEQLSVLSVFNFIERENEMARLEEERKKKEEERKKEEELQAQLAGKPMMTQKQQLDAALAAEKPVPQKLPFPCILSFTAPAPSNRQVGLAAIIGKPSSYNTVSEKEEEKAKELAAQQAVSTAAAAASRRGGPRSGSPNRAPGRPNQGDSKGKNDPKNKKNGKDGGGQNKEGEDEDEEVEGTDYNKRLRELEQKAWDFMVCVHTNDVLNKLMSEDTEPVLASAVNFAMDEYGIWNGKREIPPPKDKSSNTSMAYHIPTPVKEKKGGATGGGGGGGGEAKPVEAAEESEPEPVHPTHLSTEVLPFSFQLRPYTELRGPHGLFRLFFFEGELLACSQASSWAFYNEVFQNRDAILRAIKSFSTNSAIKNLVRVYGQRANPNVSTTNSSYMMLPPINRSAEDNTNGGQVSFFLPGENLLFNRMDHPLDIVGGQQKINKVTIDSDYEIDYENFYYSKSDMQKIRTFNYLTDAKIIALDHKYKFLSKIHYWGWKDRVKRSQTNFRNAKRIEQAAKEEEKKKQKELEEYRKSTGTKDNKGEIDTNSLQGIFNATRYIGETFIENYGLTKEVAEKFKQDFQKYVTNTDTSIKNRMIWRESDGPVPEAKYDLIAIDVLVNLKHPRDLTPEFTDIFKRHGEMIKAASKASKIETAAKLQTKGGLGMKGGGGKELEGDSNSDNMDQVSVALHQIVGIFSTENEKAPPNVDFGLYEWETFLEFRKRRNANTPVSEFNKPPVSQIWSSPNHDTGVSIFRNTLLSGNEFSMKILGDKLSQDYLAEILPKKVKNWIGMP